MFGITDTIVVQPVQESERKVEVDASEKIKTMVQSESWYTSTMSWSTSSQAQVSNSLSEQDKRDVEQMVDGLVIK